MVRFGRCSICTDGFELSGISSLKGCGHTFHFTCISLWLESKKTCPNCRKKALVKDITKLFIDDAESSRLSISFTENAPGADELREELQNERVAKQKLLDTMAELQEQKEHLTVELAKGKNNASLLKRKEEHIRTLEAMLADQNALKKELDVCKQRLRASELWALLSKDTGTSTDEQKIDELLGKNGYPDSQSFFNILRNQQRNLQQQYRQKCSEHTSEAEKVNKYKRLVAQMEVSEARLKESNASLQAELVESRKQRIVLRKQLLGLQPSIPPSVSTNDQPTTSGATISLETSDYGAEYSGCRASMSFEAGNDKSFGFSYRESDERRGLDKTHLLLSAKREENFERKEGSIAEMSGGWNASDDSLLPEAESASQLTEDVEVPAAVMRRAGPALPLRPAIQRQSNTVVNNTAAYEKPTSGGTWDHAGESAECSFNFSIEPPSPTDKDPSGCKVVLHKRNEQGSTATTTTTTSSSSSYGTVFKRIDNLKSVLNQRVISTKAKGESTGLQYRARKRKSPVQQIADIEVIDLF